MALPADEFVRAVMAHLNVDNASDLVRAMRWGVNDASTVSKWLGGKTTPSYERLMDMLERCGWLNMSADARGAEATRRAPVTDIQRGIGQLLDGQEELLEIARYLQLVAQHDGIRLHEGTPARSGRRK